MKVYTIRQLIDTLTRDKQTLLYTELREVLGYDKTQLSRRINKRLGNSIDFKGSEIPLVCSTLSKHLNKVIKIEDLYSSSQN